MSFALPLHIKITELLSREISAGRWQSGERLPPEAELAATLGVAVGTLRKALAQLEQQSVIERRQGSGTYVRQTALGKGVYDLFRLELLHGGGLPTAQIISLDCIAHPEQVPIFGNTEAPAQRQCFRLRRLRSLNQTVVALEEIYFDARHHPGLQAQDLGEALYLHYQTHFGFWIAKAQDAVSAATIPAWVPSGFTLSAGAACGFIRRHAWASNDALEEYSLSWFNPSAAHYVSRLK